MQATQYCPCSHKKLSMNQSGLLFILRVHSQHTASGLCVSKPHKQIVCTAHSFHCPCFVCTCRRCLLSEAAECHGLSALSTPYLSDQKDSTSTLNVTHSSLFSTQIVPSLPDSCLLAVGITVSVGSVLVSLQQGSKSTSEYDEDSSSAKSILSSIANPTLAIFCSIYNAVSASICFGSACHCELHTVCCTKCLICLCKGQWYTISSLFIIK